MHSLLYNMKLFVSVFEIMCLQRGGKGSVILHYLSNISHQMLICFYITSDAYKNDHLTLRRLMSYIYAAPILDVSRSHTTTQHSR